jgi:hypothetical protein
MAEAMEETALDSNPQVTEEEVSRKECGETQQRIKYEKQEDHGMRSRGQLKIATLGSSSWMLYAPQEVKGLDDDIYVYLCVYSVQP